MAVHKTTPEEIRAWVVYEDEDMLVFNKDGALPCHPAKDGPWSCLSSAVREVFHLEQAHLVFRLDRETSGLVLFAKTERIAKRLQRAAQQHRYGKRYLALLHGEIEPAFRVDVPLGRDWMSPVQAKSRAYAPGEGGQEAETFFRRLASGGGFSLAEVRTRTGRKHQIRAHAQAVGHGLVGDKIYGPDPKLFLEFIDTGWTPALAERLLVPRQALHCCEIDLRPAGLPHVFWSGWPADLAEFTAPWLPGWTWDAGFTARAGRA